MQNRLSRIQHEDIISSAAFKNWLKSNMSVYVNKEIPNEHLLIYLDYVEERIRENNKIDRAAWLHTAKELREKIKVISENEF